MTLKFDECTPSVIAELDKIRTKLVQELFLCYAKPSLKCLTISMFIFQQIQILMDYDVEELQIFNSDLKIITFSL